MLLFVCFFFFFFFFFKQKTAYEIRLSLVGSEMCIRDRLTEEDENQPLYADSAYTGAKLEQAIMEHKMSNQVCEKGYRNNPLTTEQQANNRIKSKTRARVEHVFGFMEQSMRGLYIWSIGLPRATGILGLINLTYNIFRYKQLIRRTA